MSTIKPRKRKDRNKWTITYRITGYERVFEESFDTEAEANARAAEIMLQRERGTLRPPIKVIRKKELTLSEFLDEYVEKYGVSHWGDSQYGVVTKQFRDYVKPSGLGSLLLRDITAADVDDFYVGLLSTPAVRRNGVHDTGKTVGSGVIEKLHSSLRAAFTQAVKWGYLAQNPAANASVPKMEHNTRKVWSPQEAMTALDACKGTLLYVCILLGIGCSMRIGEILGLQWDCVDITEESIRDNSSTLQIRQELKRCEKASLEAIEKHNADEIYFRFPERKVKNPCKTVLVLKSPKTASSRRTVYIPNSVAEALLKLKETQQEDKKRTGSSYHDYNMVIAQKDGRPTEERWVREKLENLCKETNLPKVVFHSLRHLSTSMKLKLSGGDIKAVQGDTGHSQARMVTDVYSHTFDENRKNVAGLMESSFFAAGSRDDQEIEERKKTEQLMTLLRKNPDLAELMLRLAQTNIS